MIFRKSQIFSLASIIWSIMKSALFIKTTRGGGGGRHEAFVCERLGKCEVSLTDSIKRVALQTFAKHTDTKSKDNNKVNALKKNVPLVSHLFYIRSQGQILLWMNSLSMRTKESHHLYLYPNGYISRWYTSDCFGCSSCRSHDPPDQGYWFPSICWPPLYPKHCKRYIWINLTGWYHMGHITWS